MVKKKSIHKGIIYFLAVFVVITSIILISYVRIRHYVKHLDQRFDSALEDTEDSYKEWVEDIKKVREYEKERAEYYADIYSYVINEKTLSSDDIDALTDAQYQVYICYLGDDGTMITSSDEEKSSPFQNKRALYDSLDKNTGILTVKDQEFIYGCRRMKKGRIIAGSYIHDYPVAPMQSKDVLLWNTKDNSLIFAKDVMDQSFVENDFFLPESETAIQKLFQPLKCGHTKAKKYYLYKKKQIDDEYTFVASFELHVMVEELSRELGIIFVLIPLVVFTMTNYAIKIYCNMNEEEDTSKKNTKKSVLNMERVYLMSTLLIVCCIIAGFMTVYIQLLISYCDQNIRAESELTEFANRIELCKEKREDIDNYINDYVKVIAEQIGNAAEYNDKLLDDEILEQLYVDNEYLKISDIVFITKDDIDSVTVDFFEDYYGFSEEIRKQLDSFFKGKERNRLFSINRYGTLVMQRLRDEKGIIGFLCNTTLLSANIGGNYYFVDAVAFGDFDKADKMFVYKKKPRDSEQFYYDEQDNVFVQPRGEKEQKCVSVTDTLIELLQKDDYCGIGYIDGKYYYINTKEYIDKDKENNVNNSIILINALPMRIIVFRILQSLAAELIVFLVMFGILVQMTGRDRYILQKDMQVKEDGEAEASVPKEDEFEESETHYRDFFYIQNIQETILKDSFQKAVSRMFNICLTLLVVLFTWDGIFSKNSLGSYLMRNNWKSGLNLFSMTKILAMLIIVMIIGSVAQKFLMIISKSMGKRGATIGHLMISMVQFGSLVIVVVYSLVQLGLNLNSLLAGAGLAGAALAIAGQSVVNDLLSGFFVVFEGKFGVGDWVTVGDFRGQIQEIGVRTTTIAYAGDIKVFHNSALSGITVWSHGMCGAICYVDVAYREDIEHVFEVLKKNKHRYREEIPEMETDISVHGVTELGSSGITLRITSYLSDQSNTGMIQRGMYRVTKRIFDENNITIPFPQVVIHEGDKDIPGSDIAEGELTTVDIAQQK